MAVDYSQEKEWWDKKAHCEELDTIDERINRRLRWNVIDNNLDGVKTIAEIGAATGAFTIPLAERGFRVTHIDFSPEMLAIARKRARGISNIDIIEANSTDLRMFPENEFDLVLNMDGAISFCGEDAEKAIAESSRITKKKLIITVSNKAWMIPVWLSESIQKSGTILPAVLEMFDKGHWHYHQFESNKKLSDGYFGTLRAFSLLELKNILEKNGIKVNRIHGLGSLANLCSSEKLKELKDDGKLFDEFITLCERYDNEILPEGPGTKQRAGLLAIGFK